MELSKKSVGIIVALIVISVAGLIILQAYLIRMAIDQKRQAFDRNVISTLNTVVSELEAKELSEFIHAGGGSDQSTGTAKVSLEMANCVDDSVMVVKKTLGIRDISEMPQLFRVENGKLAYKLNSKQQVNISAFSDDLMRKKVIVDTVKGPGNYSIELEDDSSFGMSYSYSFQTDSSDCVIKVSNGKMAQVFEPDISGSEKHMFVAMTVDRLADAEFLPIKNRIDTAILDSLLKDNFTRSGIDLDFGYGVQTDGEDSLVIANPISSDGELLRSEYRATLFPRDIFAPKSELLVSFPDKGFYILRQTGLLTFSTVVFMLVVMFCFVYTIRTIIYQKQFAGRLVDFINNLTHEFKTPISTISLAGEAIKKPEIISDREKILRYNKIIEDENNRMKNQVDKILQLAVLERGDYKLDRVEIDVHEIIEKAAKNISLRLENSGGNAETSLDARRSVVTADPVHLSNIIYSLLDNAIKYSGGNPEIEIATRNSKGGITISVSDKGIGIDPALRKTVFDKYFRVPSGNLHNVKGFGLGLSYVKLMMEAHGGEVDLMSEIGKGTTVNLYFPDARGSEL